MATHNNQGQTLNSAVKRFNSGLCRGFTLMELVITLVLVAILASIAVPQYLSYVLEARRSDATGTLQKILNQQSLYYANNGGTYTSAVREIGFTPVASSTDTTESEKGHYQVLLSGCDGGGTPLTECVLVTATTASAKQQKDTQCARIGINSRGTMFAQTAQGDTSTQIREACWN